jgi:hypothetical protein
MLFRHIVTCRGETIDRILNSILDLLTTYTHLQALTTVSLISTLHKSRQHPLSLLQPAVSSPAVPWQRFLTVEILQFHAIRFYLRSLPCRTQLSAESRLTPRLAAISHHRPGLLFTGWLSTDKSQSHIATDGQSISKSSCRAPSGAHDQIFITVWQLQSCFLWDTLSDERTGLSFVHDTAPCQRSLSRVRVPWDSRPYFTDWQGRPSCSQDNSSARAT